MRSAKQMQGIVRSFYRILASEKRLGFFWGVLCELLIIPCPRMEWLRSPVLTDCRGVEAVPTGFQGGHSKS
jgi:hypothetical protein